MKTSYKNLKSFLESLDLEVADFQIYEYDETEYARTWIRHEGESYCITFPSNIKPRKRLMLSIEERESSKGTFVAVFGYNPKEEKESWSINL